ncbi:MAG: hypothetical protein KGL39_01505 [Patescibacteria group bacterium]|nr:hypothetical protein [Patescibacteria group bacterium]
MSKCANDIPANREGIYYTGWNCGGCQPCKSLYDVAQYDQTNDSSHGISCLGDLAGFGKYVNRCNTYCAPGPDTYPSDPDTLADCCTNNDPTVQKKCKPGYCPGTKKCNDLMFQYCSNSFDLQNVELCKAWCKSEKGAGLCDAAADKYCKQHPTDRDFCACKNSPLASAIGGGVSLPPCFDGNCHANGYKTSSDLRVQEHCPDVCNAAINCIQTSHGTCQIDHNQFAINCKGEPPAPTPPPQNQMILVLIILLIGIAMMLIGFAAGARAPGADLNKKTASE